ncbi:hypothetical protein PUNSTDRAFT_50377 [Punctularia strigosozonata HHB-11173 SS5]|uniref:uncharacterized protein n=1 Tax=Punctularia strigosozonata (strain HHB-11173) TaxID=741275 RepID=UPI000441826E|nr:uncharacterized protein PUNSTDRAFT_50377 [Punctularia strigosozonata HHB-11173 SS5]EIN11322.1 hypothetical protein PUNSTDRAFT_50377 [Punctularia strigosozonata HHB-11173 SS5]
MAAAPPAYTTDASLANASSASDSSDAATRPSDAPPSYHFPTAFTIGSKKLDNPLVDVPELKVHLDLLGAFYVLKNAVSSGVDERLPQPVRALAEPEQRWGWFVSLAVERFQRWLYDVKATPLDSWVEQEVPPLDVWMVWHAYLLNPAWYAEDCTRLPIMAPLKKLRDRFLPALARIGDPFTYRPSPERADFWLKRTGTPFDPLDACSALVDREVQCPKCGTVVVIPYIDADGTGYAQQNFKVACRSKDCNFEITKETLAVQKFMNNLAIDLQDAKQLGYEIYMAGSLRTSTESKDTARAHNVKIRLLLNPVYRHLQDMGKKTPEERKAALDAVAKSHDFKMIRVRAFAGSKMPGMIKLLGRIASAYVDDRPFSVELVGAVLRQGSFVDKMHALGWTNPDYFRSADDEVVLKHCIARYHAFLDLMAHSPAGFFVPTLDIDLAWHTHQLKADKYHVNCMTFVGRHIDHDDKVEENRLANSFDLTCRAWKSRFGIPYMHCGCPVPGDTIGQKMSRLTKHVLSGSSTEVHSDSPLVPPSHPEALASTHPSDHNAVYSFTHRVSSEAARTKRRLKLEKRQQREKGAADEKARAWQHEPAFLVPVPLWYGYAPCAGYAGVVNSATWRGRGPAQ